jgi:hypothetical protein
MTQPNVDEVLPCETKIVMEVSSEMMMIDLYDVDQMYTTQMRMFMNYIYSAEMQVNVLFLDGM